jgi:16S rRNA (guanine1207-N2)-methyltransferase
VERASQLLLRNTAALAGGSLLMVNPERDACYSELSAGDRQVRIFTQDYGDYRWFCASGAEVEFGLTPPSASYRKIVLFQAREKARLDMLLHACALSLDNDGKLWLVGENRSGIKSCAKRLKNCFSQVSKSDSARHCTLFCAQGALPLDDFRPGDYEEHWQVEVFGQALEMVSLPGSFAHGRLDRGTRELLTVLRGIRPEGRVLDFGCGSGAIGLALLKRDPGIELTLLDTSSSALESARRSMQANGLEALLLPSDGLDGVTQAQDWIISNPPFHKGVGTDFGIVRRFFEQSNRILAKNGKMLLVCNRHLPYEAWLEQHFYGMQSLYSGPEFKIILAQKPRA